MTMTDFLTMTGFEAGLFLAILAFVSLLWGVAMWLRAQSTATFTLSITEPSWPGDWTKANGWSAPDHRPLGNGTVTVTFRDGEMYIDGVKVIEELSPEQQRGGVIRGKTLQKYLANQPNLPDTLIELLIREQDNEEVAKFLERFESRNPSFWGTPYKSPVGFRCVRYLIRCAGRWSWSFIWLGDDWDRLIPALVLAHPLEA